MENRRQKVNYNNPSYLQKKNNKNKKKERKIKGTKEFFTRFFLLCLGRKEQAKLIANGEKSDQGMWVPSDLESESQIKKDGGSTKMEEDLGNCGGELLSEGELLPFLPHVMKKQQKRKKKITEQFFFVMSEEQTR